MPVNARRCVLPPPCEGAAGRGRLAWALLLVTVVAAVHAGAVRAQPTTAPGAQVGASAAPAPADPTPPADPGDGLSLLEAVELALANDPNIALVEARVAASQGSLLAASGAFDPLLTSDVAASENTIPDAAGPASSLTVISTTVGLSTLLRSGLSLAPEVEIERSANGFPTANSATVAFTLRQPLLRGRGREVVTASERAAEHELAASRMDLRHAVSLRLRAVAFQYWATVAAAQDLEVLRTTESASRDLLATTRRLIEADLTPAAEIVQLEADLVAREASRIAGEQALFAARQDLGREIGLDPAGIRDLPLPDDPFPAADMETPPGQREEAYRRQALARRADLGAAVERLAGAEAFLLAAEDALQPRLDLLLTPSYAGLVEGSKPGDFLSPLVQNVPGLSTSLVLNLSWPTRNRQSRGNLIEAEAVHRQSELVVESAAKGIGAEVPVALDAVWRSALQLDSAVKALGLFERTLENEERKLRAGSSTLIDVISQRDRLTAARRRRVSAQLALALALVELRFQTGTLIAGDEQDGTISEAELTTVPSPDAP